ncbi:MAG: HupE/UreJ family protein [Pseudohongiella sp.]|nr:HupE/UreJ family protein [Pseudohongiella sp.]MDP2127326.1 HupE/UreJ family protein [Pseudohongiella sp.]
MSKIRSGYCRIAVLFVIVWILQGAQTASAHYLDIAQFTFYESEEAGRFRLRVDNLPQSSNPVQPVQWPQGCELLSRQQSSPGFLPSVEFEIGCAGGTQGVINTQWGRDGGRVVFEYRDGTSSSMMLTGARSGITLALPDFDEEIVARSAASTAWLYLTLGTEHVLIGWDHLAFVFCLAMLASGVSLLWLITAFTVGHSLSLALSFFGIVSVPIGPVEAVIALSVVFMAREAIFYNRFSTNAVTNEGSLKSQRGKMALTAAFGLIHGLGFASVLGELGVSPSDTVIALAFFNIGVEVGQVLFVLAVLAFVRLCRTIRFDMYFIRAALGVVGGLGVFWTVERVLGV